MPRSLKEYERKRNFSKTNEPSGRRKGKRKMKARRRHPRFAFQKHSATSEHYDLRLEVLEGMVLGPHRQALVARIE